MDWWQHALISFGAKTQGDQTIWNCLICKDIFETEEGIKGHLNSHNFEDFKALKFEVTVKGLKGDDWKNTIDVNIDKNSKEEVSFNENQHKTHNENVDKTTNQEEVIDQNDKKPQVEESLNESQQNVEVDKIANQDEVVDKYAEYAESTPLTRRSTAVRKRLSLEDIDTDHQVKKKVKHNETTEKSEENEPESETDSNVASNRVNLRGKPEGNDTPAVVITNTGVPLTNEMSPNCDGFETTELGEINLKVEEVSDTVHVLIENRDTDESGTKQSEETNDGAVGEEIAEETTSDKVNLNVSIETFGSRKSENKQSESGHKDKQGEVRLMRSGKSGGIKLGNKMSKVTRKTSKLQKASCDKSVITFVRKVKSKKLKSKGPLYTCDTCDYECESHGLYHRHIISHVKDKPILCWYCETEFTKDYEEEKKQELQRKFGRKRYNSEDETHETKEKAEVASLDYTCFFCSYSFESNAVLDQHLFRVHTEEISCKTADEIAALKASTKMGKAAEIMSAESFYCHICQWKSDRHFNYHRHVLTHTIGKSFKCTYCRKVISPNNSKTGYGQISNKCPECQEIFHSKFKMSLHMFEVHKMKSAGSRQCNICGFVCRTKKLIEKHHILAHGPENFNHDDITIIKKPVPEKEPTRYNCEKCGYITMRKDNMAKHMLTHIPESDRSLYCCVQCDYMSYAESSLNMHVSRKHRKKDERASPMKCDRCRRFTTTEKLDLIEHRNSCLLLCDEDSNGNESRLGTKDSDPNIMYDAVMTPALGETSGYLKDLDAVDKSDKKAKTTYMCDECYLTFDRRWNLHRHKECAHKKAIYKCEYCNHSTKNFKILNCHYINVHMKQPPDYIIALMKAGAPKEDVEKVKIKELTVKRAGRKQNKVECQFCGIMVNAYNLKAHLNNKHFDKKLYACHHKDCGYEASTTGNLKTHILRMHFNQMIRKSSVNKQIDNHPMVKEYMESMKEIFTSIDQMEYPEDEKTLKMCSKCNFKSFSIGDIQRHHESGGCPSTLNTQDDISQSTTPDIESTPKQLLSQSNTNLTSTPIQQATTHISKGFVNLITSAVKSEKDGSENVFTILNEPPSYSEAIGKRASTALWNEQQQPVVFVNGKNMLDNGGKTVVSTNEESNQELLLQGDRVVYLEEANEDETIVRISETDTFILQDLRKLEELMQNKTYSSERNDMVSFALQQSAIDTGQTFVVENPPDGGESSQMLVNPTETDDENKLGSKELSDNEGKVNTCDNMESNEEITTGKDKANFPTPQFIIDKKSNGTTLITVQQGDLETSYEIHGHLNVGPNGELPTDLYNFIAEMLQKQTSSEGQSENVVYCDIVVNDK